MAQLATSDSKLNSIQDQTLVCSKAPSLSLWESLLNMSAQTWTRQLPQILSHGTPGSLSPGQGSPGCQAQSSWASIKVNLPICPPKRTALMSWLVTVTVAYILESRWPQSCIVQLNSWHDHHRFSNGRNSHQRHHLDVRFWLPVTT